MVKILLILVIILSSCTKNSNKTSEVRIVSTALVADDLLLELGLDKEIVAFSSLAKDANYSLIANNPIVKSKKSASLTNLEAIVKLKPSLVLVSELSDKTSIDRLQQLNITIHVVKTPVTFNDLYRIILDLGTVLNKKQEASSLVSALKIKELEMLSHLSDEKHEPKTILFYSSSGVASRISTLHEIATKANLINLASNLPIIQYGMASLSDEQLLKLNPDYLIINSYDNSLQYLQSHPILKDLKALKLDKLLIFGKEEELKLYSISHYMVDAMVILHNKIYKEK